MLSLAVAAAANAQQRSTFSYPLEKGKLKVEALNCEKVKSEDGEKMRLSMNMDFDSLRIPSNSFVAVTPVLVSKDKTMSRAYRPTVVSGKRQYIVYQRDGKLLPEYEGSQVYKLKDLKESGALAYTDESDYEPWMSGASLYFINDKCGCCEREDSTMDGPFYRIKRNPVDYATYAVPKKKVDMKTFKLHGTAFVNFVVDRTEINPVYMNNPRELRKITDTLDIMVADKNVTVDQIKIHGFASPESPYTHNEELATGRAQALTDYVHRKYGLPGSVFAKAEATPENWEDLRDSVAVSDLAHKSEILSIIDKALANPRANADKAEAQIKRSYPAEYKRMLREIYPHLRRSDYEVTFTVRKFAVEEAKEILKSKSVYLSAEELSELVAVYPVGSKDYNLVLDVAKKNFEGDERSNLIMAIATLKREDLASAQSFLDKSGNSPESDNVRGVLKLMNNDYDGARKLFKSASDAGVKEAEQNLQNMDE